MTRRFSPVLGMLIAATAVGSILAVSVRAGDPPPAAAPAAAPECPPVQKKLDHPLLNAMIGEWSITFSATGPDGKVEEGTATSKAVLGIAGTAIVDDYNASGMGGSPFGGLGVYKVSDDGKTVSCWWFDNMGPEPMKLTGPITDTSLEMTGTIPGMGTMKIVEKKVEGGFDWEGTMDGKPMMTQKIRKATK